MAVSVQDFEKVPMPERVLKLKSRVIIKAQHMVDRGAARGTRGSKPFREGVKLCIERPRLLTEGYKANEHLAMVLKRAKAIDHVLTNMTIWIQPDEIIVGNFASNPYSVSHYPEMQYRWVDKTLENIYADLTTEEERLELKEIHKYWSTRAVHGMERELVPDLAKGFWQYKAGLPFFVYNFEYGTPDYAKIFKVGMNGILAEIHEYRQKLDDDFVERRIETDEYVAKKQFYQAAEISLQSVIKFAKRYSDLAAKMATEESNPIRKKELEKIADTMGRVPANPCTSLYDALQVFLLIHLVVNYIEAPQVGCGIRADIIFNDYYQADRAKGLTEADALELFGCTFVKMLETGFLHPPIYTGGAAGSLGWQTINLGGVDAEGNDASNDITYLVLETIKQMNAVQPPLGLRWHKNTPRRLLLKVADVYGAGVPQPALFNDEVNIPRYLERGMTLEDARNYTITTCMFPTVPGKNMRDRAPTTHLIVLPKLLELVLNGGKDMITGEQLGLPTQDPLTFKSVDEVVDALMENYKHFALRLFQYGKIADWLYAKYLQRPLLSATMSDCLEVGKDCNEWKNVPYASVVNAGHIIVGDSLAALNKLVFKDKKVTMEELHTALKADWTGYENMRQLFSNVPKWGNDNEETDIVTRDFYYRLEEETRKFSGYFGTKVYQDGSQGSIPYGYSVDVAATPDGRKKGDPFNDGTIAPVPGRDMAGPTAALKSVSKIEVDKSFNHLFTQNFEPQYVTGEFQETFVDYLRTWGELGVQHIQFNTLGVEKLKEAQAKPEENRNLIVRVAGYAAYFIDLDKGTQDYIISRTPQKFGGC